MELSTTPDPRPRRLLRYLQTAGRPVRIEGLLAGHDDPVALAALARDLRELHAHGVIEATPLGWLWRHGR